MTCLLGCVTWRELQRCKLTEVLSSPDTTAYLSSVSPIPAVHESPNDVHSLSLQCTSGKRMKFVFCLKLTLKYAAHTYTHTYIHTLRGMDKPYSKAFWQAAGDGAEASCSCPTSAQLSEPRAAFEQPITPTQHRGKAISSRGTPLSHQMVWEMNRAIILVLDNSSDEAN